MTAARVGLKPEELLDLTIYQYNAYCDGYRLRQADELVAKVEAAYYSAYWNGAQKHKKSLNTVVKSIYKGVTKNKKPRKPIDVKATENDFAKMEGLKKYGWCKD